MEKISPPSALDVRFLLALLDHPQNAYQIARQAELDAKSDVRIASGTYQGAIKRLEHISLAERRNNDTYQITPLGEQVLDWELKRYARFIKLANQRRHTH